MLSQRLQAGARQALATLLAAIASFCTLWLLCRACTVQPQPAVLAAILAIVLGRRAAPRGIDAVAIVAGRIAGIAIAASGIGWLLRHVPVAGAAVFVAGMFFSVWLRDRGERARAVGALIALPLVAMLVVPGPTRVAPGGPLVDLALAVAAGVVALSYVTAIDALARRLRLADTGVSAAERFPLPPREPRTGMTPATRMAWQLAVALCAAFVVGFIVFPEHWGWVVLTAYIVCGSARGREDAVYKAVLRLTGALAGTVGAAALANLWAPTGPAEAVAIFAVLYAGLALRDVNYAYWACSTTLILSLLGRSNQSFALGLFVTRIEAIVVGAICGIVAAWFVFPIPTEAVVRRRLADVLLALDDVVANAHLPGDERAHAHATFHHRMRELDDVDAPVRWHWRVFVRRGDADHPARWIDLARGVRDHAQTYVSGPNTKRVRQAIGISRRSIAQHGKADAPDDRVPIGTALERLRTEIAPHDD